MVLLAALSLVMLSEALFGMHGEDNPLFQQGVARFVAGMVAGFGIGVVAALLGVVIGGMMLGLVSARLPMDLLGVVLFISAIKTFQHAH